MAAPLVLTSANFTSFTSAPGSRVLVEFYLPWCGFCQKLESAYAAAAKQIAKLREEDSSLVAQIARVEIRAVTPDSQDLIVRSLYLTLMASATHQHSMCERESARSDLNLTRRLPRVPRSLGGPSLDRIV